MDVDNEYERGYGLSFPHARPRLHVISLRNSNDEGYGFCLRGMLFYPEGLLWLEEYREWFIDW